MGRPERQGQVLEILKDFRGSEPLKKLFWQELNYERVNKPLSRQGWSDTARNSLADDPVLFASGGEGFHIIHARLSSDKLLIGQERPVVARLLQDHPYALFVFSDSTQSRWHFLNVKYDDDVQKEAHLSPHHGWPGRAIADGFRTGRDAGLGRHRPGSFRPLAPGGPGAS